MTLTDVELNRLADMAAALRPDWPARSIHTLLRSDHGHRAYADVAVALAAVACDPATKTPKRLGEHGRWWSAAQVASGAGVESTPMPPRANEWCPDHFGPAHNCPGCRADELAAGYVGPSDPPTIPADQAATNHTGAATVRAAIRQPDARERAAGEREGETDE